MEGQPVSFSSFFLATVVHVGHSSKWEVGSVLMAFGYKRRRKNENENLTKLGK